jgi:hypothetical protein
MKNLLFAAIVAIAVYAGYTEYARRTTEPVTAGATSAAPVRLDQRADNTQVEGEGVVSRILADDSDGDRHQRFILRLASGQTVLVAHNIDLAPRIADLHEGDTVAFNGEYVWNAKGGVVHWTHHDPSGQHHAGWLKHGGRIYQ